MARNGSDKYADLCRYVLERSKGEAAVVIIVSGSASAVNVQEDFSVAGSEYHMARLPKILRKIAEEIESE